MLNKHKISFKAEEEFQCEICKLTFSLERTLKEHITSAHTVKLPYGCESCDVNFSQRSDLKRHIALEHTDTITRMVEDFK